MNDQCADCEIRKQCDRREPDDDWTCEWYLGYRFDEFTSYTARDRLIKSLEEAFDLRPSTAVMITDMLAQTVFTMKHEIECRDKEKKKND